MLSLQEIGIRQKSPSTGWFFLRGKCCTNYPSLCGAECGQGRGFRKGGLKKISRFLIFLTVIPLNSVSLSCPDVQIFFTRLCVQQAAASLERVSLICRWHRWARALFAHTHANARAHTHRFYYLWEDRPFTSWLMQLIKCIAAPKPKANLIIDKDNFWLFYFFLFVCLENP